MPETAALCRATESRWSFSPVCCRCRHVAQERLRLASRRGGGSPSAAPQRAPPLLGSAAPCECGACSSHPPAQEWPAFRDWRVFDTWRRYHRMRLIVPPLPYLEPGRPYLFVHWPHATFPMGAWLSMPLCGVPETGAKCTPAWGAFPAAPSSSDMQPLHQWCHIAWSIWNAAPSAINVQPLHQKCPCMWNVWSLFPNRPAACCARNARVRAALPAPRARRRAAAPPASARLTPARAVAGLPARARGAVASILFRLPVVKHLFTWMGCLPADRHAMLGALRAGCSLGVMPEARAPRCPVPARPQPASAGAAADQLPAWNPCSHCMLCSSPEAWPVGTLVCSVSSVCERSGGPMACRTATACQRTSLSPAGHRGHLHGDAASRAHLRAAQRLCACGPAGRMSCGARLPPRQQPGACRPRLQTQPCLPTAFSDVRLEVCLC
jgi:hypothetical protein